MAIKQRQIFDEFSKTFPEDVVREWDRMVKVWNIDPQGSPDPYEEPETSEFA